MAFVGDSFLGEQQILGNPGERGSVLKLGIVTRWNSDEIIREYPNPARRLVCA